MISAAPHRIDKPLGLIVEEKVVLPDSKIDDDLRRASFDATNHLRQARYTQEASAISSLQVVNAGGAVALLAFLGQTWAIAAELRIVLVIAVALMLTGLLLAVCAGFQLPDLQERRYRINESVNISAKYQGTLQLYMMTVISSFLLFMIAIVIVVIVVLRNR